jgi:hypothetical protein
MFRKLVAKVLKSLVKLVEGEKTVIRNAEDYLTVTSTKETASRGVKVHETHEVKKNNLDDMDREEKKAYINNCLEDIGAELYVKGYKALTEILEQYETEIVQAYVISQLVNLGMYSPEQDNIDSLNRKALIERALTNNQLQFRQRMIEQGKAQVSPAQIKMINDLSKQLKVQPVTPKDKFEASEIIEALNKRLGNEPNNGSASSAQVHAIEVLCKKLGKELAICEVAVDSKTASKTIQDLQNELKAHPELDKPTPATKEQVEYVKRLLALQKKRWTAKRETEYSSMSSSDISKAIASLKEECIASGLISTKATEGQVKYILNLGKLLKKSYNPDEVKNLEATQASKVIETLQREYLYFLYRGNGNKITKEEIAVLSVATVRQLIEQLQLERRTNLYEKSAEGYTSTQQVL